MPDLLLTRFLFKLLLILNASFKLLSLPSRPARKQEMDQAFMSHKATVGQFPGPQLVSQRNDITSEPPPPNDDKNNVQKNLRKPPYNKSMSMKIRSVFYFVLGCFFINVCYESFGFRFGQMWRSTNGLKC